ncbi:uncharacterized protein CLAFUR5_06879 [Fulvia fulva]|uniref:Thioesterase domain-containing protein n=1 Tax=Passalora fulva TaxID=5499 RepID=A0A9Q8URB0_PASFU|nr:uncharacterized protein CLAFUR5_06879 [Fulvia fulva]KAK4622752.1 hypothetical protein CLAFUR0_06745 [Fulvia fulva]UJO19540.1 hypothetical protein CLAFUR5_06879 [Fulvia fulva]
MSTPRSKKEIPSTVHQTTVDHFKAQPWTRPTLQDPAFRIVSMSREVTHGGHGHTLMGRTWNTDSTVQHLLSLSRPSTASDPSSFPQSETDRAEVRRFYTFGKDLNAHPNLLHGGVIGCILDSTLGGVVGMALSQTAETSTMFTVQLNISYKKPIKTPGSVMLRSWVTKVEGNGRKVWAKGVVEGEGGVVHAVAEGMWLGAKGKL